MLPDSKSNLQLRNAQTRRLEFTRGCSPVFVADRGRRVDSKTRNEGCVSEEGVVFVGVAGLSLLHILKLDWSEILSPASYCCHAMANEIAWR